MRHSDLAPGLLLAAPVLRDPNFEKTVVCLGRHGEDGALGWVLNGQELMSVSEIFASTDLVPSGAESPHGPGFERVACVGGPVAPASGWLLYRRGPEPLPGELEVGADLGVTAELAAFASLARGDGPADFRLVLGCAGWGPGQLESEIGAGAWLPAAVDAALVFDTPRNAIWDEAYQRSIGTGPAAFTSRRGRA